MVRVSVRVYSRFKSILKQNESMPDKKVSVSWITESLSIDMLSLKCFDVGVRVWVRVWLGFRLGFIVDLNQF